MKISVVIPVYNEEENIFELYERLKKVLIQDFSSFTHEILYVDDGSFDKTLNVIKELQLKDSDIKILQLSRNFGHHVAISAGLDNAEGDFIVTMDGDLQDQPEELIKLYNKLQEGYDVVFGDRQNKKFSYSKILLSKIFISLIQLLIAEKIVINSHVFRIMRKDVVDKVKECRETNRYVIGLIGWVGFKHSSISVEHGKRFKGETKYNFGKLVKLALDAIFSFSNYPLRLVVYLGLGIVFLSFILIFYVFFKKIVYGVAAVGWTSLIASIFFIGGIQIFVLGLIGEYIGRIYMETKRRPLYVVKNFIKK
ncbi:TPA: glycosyltransferase [Candidatus Dependentiae bacterium]|nr:MAG: glycosyl transferase family protein [candidate division TM6 bacterium GW2011_GWE2_31_21]KKP53902.1 MAG: glycosyl transferase family protein [candidate division TM6 bacterium GW2011_GWF2_33_332]HBS47682.1 glycosyltransferase [Candidatus Dependentiae bacterium]HBZ73831.1 glycosyltransferase [Candidatus Dependentiae bacterium]